MLPTHQHHLSAARPEPSLAASALLALLGPLVVWAAVFATSAALTSSNLPSGQCSGIGFGCQLSPRDSVGFVALVVGVPVVGVATLVSGLGLLASPRWARTVAVTVVGLVACAAMVMAAGLVASG